jgi:predicted ribosomally synthesized peptide with SipW-like signal peptide
VRVAGVTTVDTAATDHEITPTMTDDNTGRLNLSRRKLLGSVATIGAAGAVGGAGSMAFFRDEENLANNQLTAGELDMKIAWEEHYSDWKGDEVDEAEMADPQGDPDYLLPAFDIASGTGPGFGTGQQGPLADGIDLEPLDGRPIALNFTIGQDAFWNATSIDAYPDTTDDGVRDSLEEFDFCDSDADLSGALDSDLRTASSRGEPLITLDDVKPGDFGEVTFTFHLCDNPGYVWLTGGLVDADENGTTEPEAKDEDEFGTNPPADNPDNLFDNEGDESNEENADPANTNQQRVELLDYVLTRLWRDDGDNQLDQISGQLDVVCAIDISNSLSDSELTELETGVNAFIDALDTSSADTKVGSLQFDTDVSSVNNLTDPGPDIALPGNDGEGITAMAPALDIADQLVNDQGAGARPGAEKIIVLFTDGGPNPENRSYTAGGYTAPRDNSSDWSATAGDSTYDNADGQINTVTAAEMDEALLVANSIKSGGTTIATVYVGADGEDQQGMTQDAINKYGNLPTYLATGELDNDNMDEGVASSGADAFDVDVESIEMLANQLVSVVIAGEELLFFGTLRETLQFVSAENGIPLDGNIDAEQGGGTGRDCFSAETTHHIGFEWWLPIDHGNQVQGDSVTFDLGFYTEQCRHNDGGMGNDEPEPV